MGTEKKGRDGEVEGKDFRIRAPFNNPFVYYSGNKQRPIVLTDILQNLRDVVVNTPMHECDFMGTALTMAERRRGNRWDMFIPANY